MMNRIVHVMYVLFFCAGTVEAAITISFWDLSGQPGNQTSVAGNGSTNVTANDMIRGSGLSASSGVNSFNSKGWTSETTDYIEFGFTVAAGFQVELDELFIGTRSSNTGPGILGVFTSLDNFTTSVDSLVQPGDDYLYSLIDLGSVPTVTGDFSVRLMEIGNTQADGSGPTSSSGTFRIVDFVDGSNIMDTQFTGTTSTVSTPTLPVIPVPGSFLLAILGISLLSLKKKLLH